MNISDDPFGSTTNDYYPGNQLNPQPKADGHEQPVFLAKQANKEESHGQVGHARCVHD